MCNFKIGKITTQSRSLEQRMAIAKISLHCILNTTVIGQIEGHFPFV